EAARRRGGGGPHRCRRTSAPAIQAGGRSALDGRLACSFALPRRPRLAGPRSREEHLHEHSHRRQCL
ncbi:MAG: hypothetical protein AVDCRST_MAG12-241, partial [uncultured Rubrobacteraceae bacterium]